MTPTNEVSTWTTHTEEQYRIQEQLLNQGITLVTGTSISRVADGWVEFESIYTGDTREAAATNIQVATSREPQDGLFHALADRISITRIGDCHAPATIDRAVYAGHRFARELDTEIPVGVSFRRESDLLARPTT